MGGTRKKTNVVFEWSLHFLVSQDNIIMALLLILAVYSFECTSAKRMTESESLAVMKSGDSGTLLRAKPASDAMVNTTLHADSFSFANVSHVSTAQGISDAGL